MADDNPSRTILTNPSNQESVQMDENVLLIITNLNRLLEDLKRAANELLARGIIFEDEMEKLKAAIGSSYNDPELLRNSLQELNSRLHEFGYEISNVGGGGSSDRLDGYVQEMVNLGVQCKVEMLKLKDAIAVAIRNLLIGLNLALDDSSCDTGNLDSKYSSPGLCANLNYRACNSMMRTEERVLENVSIPISPNVAAGTTSLGSESESGTESSQKLISTTTSMECGEETVAGGSVSFNLRDDSTSSEDQVEDDHQEATNEDSNGEEEGSISSEENIDEEAAANDPMNNSLESGLYTNIEGLAEEMNELLRKMNEDNDDEDEDRHQSSKAITLKNLKRSLSRKPPGDL